MRKRSTGISALKVTLLLACTLLLLALTASPVFASSQPAINLSFSPASANWAVADFDGDSQPDFAHPLRGFLTKIGYRHGVSVDLSSRGRQSFSITSDQPSLSLLPHDLDEDGDADLIVAQPLTNEPVAVWLNDGSGAFHEGSLQDYPLGRWLAGGPSLTQTQRQASPVAVTPTTKYSSVNSSGAVRIPAPAIAGIFVLARCHTLPFSQPSPAQNRAPPLSGKPTFS